jgi:hypothetical protein
MKGRASRRNGTFLIEGLIGALSERDDIARLMGWHTGEPIPHESFVRLIGHPRFPEAARALAVNMLALSERDKALDGLFKDAGRYVAALWAMYLHVTGGLTLPRLKDVCVTSAYLSPGRARALLLYLRHLGYIDLVPSGTQGDPTRYVPTDSFVAAWRDHLRAALEAARIVEPAIQLVHDRLDDREILASVAKIQGEGLLAAARVSNQDSAFIRIFMHRHAGSQIVWSLVQAGNSDAFPPCVPISFSISAAARRFGVSRIHIKRLLDDAEREGLLKFNDSGTILLEEDARAYIQYAYAVQLIRLFTAAAGTLADTHAVVAPPVPERVAESTQARG